MSSWTFLDCSPRCLGAPPIPRQSDAGSKLITSSREGTASAVPKCTGNLGVLTPEVRWPVARNISEIIPGRFLIAVKKSLTPALAPSTQQLMRLPQLLWNLQPLRAMWHACPARRAPTRVQRQPCIQPAGSLHLVVVPGIPLIAQNLRNRQALLAPRHALVAQPANFPVRIGAHHFDSPRIRSAHALARAAVSLHKLLETVDLDHRATQRRLCGQPASQRLVRRRACRKALHEFAVVL